MCGNSASSMVNPVVMPPRGQHTASLIFLHGLGDTGHGWASVLDESRKNADHVKIICPTAPVIPVTLNMMDMPAWFDIASLSFNENQDEAKIKESSKMLNDLIDEEEKLGIPSNRIMIGGFSQGGAVALYTALTRNRQLGGLVALSTWLPLHTTFPQAFVGPKRDYPVIQCHGDSDNMVNLQFGAMTSALIKGFCNDYRFKKYDGLGHSSSIQELNDVNEFIAKALPGNSSKN
ncbi:acyl-protein thioesterase 1-like [Asterias amurensis]|uniref:acyl-protein thioesterase 1-like n=1 Tax=Asterias amurensis TaxID=7602 RepID=UPI003AB65994